MARARIHKLNDALIAQIAAGEVIESPAAIVKELVENSLDANATQIDIQILGDGFEEIQVRDDGHGIHEDDLLLAVDSFATSKIRSFEELITAKTMGFRGEALGSIAAVSRLTIESKQIDSLGSQVTVDETGRSTTPSPIIKGTRVVVRDLFYNVPVRRSYYKNRAKIVRQINDILMQVTIARYGVTFRYTLDNKEPVVLPSCSHLLERLSQIFGGSIQENLLPLFWTSDGFTLEGYISKFYFYRNFASDIRLWVNKRPVEYKPLVMLLRHAYGELMPKGRFPFAALFLSVKERDIDVNVHPQKREVRFKEEIAVQNFLRQAFSRTISQEGGIAAASMVRLPQDRVGKEGNLQTATKTFGNNAPLKEAPLDQTLFSGSTLLKFSDKEAPTLLPENLALHTRIFNTFIVGTNPEGLFLIDQHTAHERINYEFFLDQLAQKKNITQNLLSALPISTDVFSHDRIKKHQKELLALGFKLNDLGPAGLALESIPSYVELGEELAALDTAIKIVEGLGGINTSDLFDQLAKDLSCRHAIRKGESASLTDFRELYAKLQKCKMPLRCPHGRPTIVRIDEKEIFAYFKRQV
ncbi:MAG: DNA mismatch repair protein MutL [Turneriella sp.]|nr:DNA mismatch repair protein MutL [Turneriella sp.]